MGTETIKAFTGSEKAGTREFKGQVVRDLKADYDAATEDDRFETWKRAAIVELQNVIRTSGADAAQRHVIGSKIGPTPVNIAAKVAKMSPEVQAALVSQLMSTPGISELLAAMQSKNELNA